MDQDLPAADRTDFNEPTATLPHTHGLIAPLWHTAALLGAFSIYAYFGVQHSHIDITIAAAGHIHTYISQMWLSWLLLGATLCGVEHRSAFFRTTLRRRAQPWRIEIRRAILIHISVFFMGGLLIGTAVAARTAWDRHSRSTTSQSERAGSARNPTDHVSPLTPTPEPTPQPLTKSNSRDSVLKLFNHKNTSAIAPGTPLQLAVWFFLSASAGFVEEHIFRGYFLMQTLGVCARFRVQPWLASAIAVVFPSILFGSLHAYEGIGGVAIITCLGMLYSISVLRFGNLRAVILAHFLQDFLAGVVFFVGAARHASGL